MNAWLAVSAALIAGLGLFHSILGERYIIRRLLRRDNIPKLFGDDSFTKLTLRYAWHVTTILALATAVLLVYLGDGADAPRGQALIVVRVLAIALATSGLWGLVATRARHWSWLVFLVAGALAWLGTVDFTTPVQR